MSYIRSLDTYAYPIECDGLVIHTNHVKDNRASNIGGKRYEHSFRYLVEIPPEEFKEMVRRILEQCRPEWVTDKMIDEWMRRRVEYFKES